MFNLKNIESIKSKLQSKKTISLFLLVLIGVLTVNYGYKISQKNHFLDFSTIYVDDLKTDIQASVNTQNIELFLLDENNYVVPVTKSMQANMDTTDYIKMIFDLYTSNCNSLPLGLRSPIVSSSRLIDWDIINKKLTLNVTKEFLNYDEAIERKVLESLAYSFTQFDEVDSVFLKVESDGVEFLKSGYYVGSGVSKSIGLNIEMDTNDPYNAHNVVVYYISQNADEEYLVPVTYIKDKDVAESMYIFDKMANPPESLSLVTAVDDDVELIDEVTSEAELILNVNSAILNSNNTLSELLIKQVLLSFGHNNEIESITVLVNGEVVETDTVVFSELEIPTLINKI